MVTQERAYTSPIWYMPEAARGARTADPRPPDAL